MFTLRHLKTLQHVSIIIQTNFRELVCSFLKSLILKFFKNVRSQRGDAAAKHLVCVRTFCVEKYAGLQSSILLHTNACTHTKCFAAASPHWLFILLTNFKISDFKKEHTSSLKLVWMMIETCWSVFKCFNVKILD